MPADNYCYVCDSNKCQKRDAQHLQRRAEQELDEVREELQLQTKKAQEG